MLLSLKDSNFQTNSQNSHHIYYIYRCQKIKEYLFPQIKKYVNGERELGSLESLSSAAVRANLDWIRFKGFGYSINNSEEYGFITCLISFSELNTCRSDIDSDEQIKKAGEIFDEGKKFVDKETVDVFQKMFDIFAKKHSATRTGSISYEHGKYEGEIVWDKPNGKGKFTYDDGSIYEGQFKDGCFNGFGIYKWTNGDHFEGMYKDDVRNGEGKYYYSNGDTFIGKYKNDLRDGEGSIMYKNGDFLHGTFHNDEIVKGYISYKDGRKYEGEWKDGKFHGKGEFRNIDKSIFNGEWKNGLKHGKFIYRDGSNDKYYLEYNQDVLVGKIKCEKLMGEVYEGDFKLGDLTGYGKYINRAGDVYEGYFVKGVIEGEGTIHYKNKDKYIGNFKNGKREGKGEYYYSKGNHYEGNFINDEIVDNGTFYYPNGDYYVGPLCNGYFHGKGVLTYWNLNRFEGTWVHGRLDGVYYLYYRNGAIEEYTYSLDKIVNRRMIKYSSNNKFNFKEIGCGQYPECYFVGEIENRNSNGYGFLLYKNGDYIFGKLNNYYLNGFGIRYIKSINCIEIGQFKDNVLDGYGIKIEDKKATIGIYKNNKSVTIINSFEYSVNSIIDSTKVVINDAKNDNGYYFGAMVNNYFEGLGIMIFQDGSIYLGEWKNGWPRGLGIYIFNENSYYIGMVNNSLLNGNGVKVEDNKYIAGCFKNNKIQ